MAIVGSLPNNIQDGQIADAVPVMANFQWIIDQVNANAASTSYVTTAIATAVATLGPAGGATQIQFDNSGVFGGSALFIWDGNNVTIGDPGSPGSGNGLLAAGSITSTHNSAITGVTGASLRYDSTAGLGYITCYNWSGAAYEPFALASTTVAMQNATGGAYKAQLDLNGSWLVGYTSTNSPSYLLQVNSQIYATNATIVTSDATVKTNVEPLGASSDIVRALKPVTFDFIPNEVHNFSTDHQVGFLAQDIQAALSGTSFGASVVHKTAAAEKHVDTGETKDEHGMMVKTRKTVKSVPLLALADTKLIPLIVKAWQEHDTTISALKEEIDKLRAAMAVSLTAPGAPT